MMILEKFNMKKKLKYKTEQKIITQLSNKLQMQKLKKNKM